MLLTWCFHRKLHITYVRAHVTLLLLRLTLSIQQPWQSQLLLCHIKGIVEVGNVLVRSQGAIVQQVRPRAGRRGSVTY